MAHFVSDPKTIELFAKDLAADDPMWVAHAPFNEFLAFLESPGEWVKGLANANGNPDKRTFVLSDHFTVEIRGVDPLPGATEPELPEVVMMGISGTGLVTVRASKTNAQKAARHFTQHFVRQALPKEFRTAHGLEDVATAIPKTVAGALADADEPAAIYDLTPEHFVTVYNKLADNQANLMVYRTEQRVFSHFKLTDRGIPRPARLGAIATFLFGCCSDASRLHGVLNSVKQDVAHFERGNADPIQGHHPQVRFDHTLPAAIVSGPAVAAAALKVGAPVAVGATVGTGTGTTLVYASDQTTTAEACDASQGSTDPTYQNGTTEVTFVKDYS